MKKILAIVLLATLPLAAHAGPGLPAPAGGSIKGLTDAEVQAIVNWLILNF